MRIASDISDLAIPTNLRIGFVPTMGALHAGHLELVRIAKRESDFVVVSIFVNPTQFGKGEDFDKYPRNLERDSALAEEAGADLIFSPSVATMYPNSPTHVHVPVVTERWEGAFRPGHFDGVATIVAKLFNIVRPSVAFFGQKDLQQCLVIQRMVSDLNFPIQLRFVPTFREADGLAMSSRNVYLSEEHRALAPEIYRTLLQTAKLIESVGSETRDIPIALVRGRDHLASCGFDVHYFDLVELANLEPIEELGKSAALITAAKLGSTRLIDNFIFSSELVPSFA